MSQLAYMTKRGAGVVKMGPARDLGPELDEVAQSARSLMAVLAEARIEYDALPEHVRAVIRHGSAIRKLLDARLNSTKGTQ